jgi:hypothetical protein
MRVWIASGSPMFGSIPQLSGRKKPIIPDEGIAPTLGVRQRHGLAR